jgi:hypothetical protein
MRRSIKAIGAAILTAALITGQAIACVPVSGDVLVPHWPVVGEQIRFPSHYAGDHGPAACSTQQAARAAVEMVAHVSAAWHRGEDAHYQDIPGCVFLLANKFYDIVDAARPFNDAAYYRVAMSNGDLVWTYVDHPTMVPVAVCQ